MGLTRLSQCLAKKSGFIPGFFLLTLPGIALLSPGCSGTLAVKQEKRGDIPVVTWETNAFYENREDTGAFNDGVIEATILGVLERGVFKTNIGEAGVSHYQVIGLPEGLDIRLSILNAEEISLHLTGAALEHRGEEKSFTLTLKDELFIDTVGTEKSYAFNLWFGEWVTNYGAVRVISDRDVLYEHPDNLGTFRNIDGYHNQIVFSIQGGHWNSDSINNEILALFQKIPTGLLLVSFIPSSDTPPTVMRLSLSEAANSHRITDSVVITWQLPKSVITATGNFIHGQPPGDGEDIPPISFSLRFGEYFPGADGSLLSLSTNTLWEGENNDGSFPGFFDISLPLDGPLSFRTTAELETRPDAVEIDIPQGLSTAFVSLNNGKILRIEIRGNAVDHSIRRVQTTLNLNDDAFEEFFNYDLEVDEEELVEGKPLFQYAPVIDLVFGGLLGRWSERQNHRALIHGPDRRLFVVGGNRGTTAYSDVWSTADGRGWRLETSPSATWGGARHGFSVFSFQNRLWVMGGASSPSFDHQTARNDVWKSSEDGRSWISVTPNAPWRPRYYFSPAVFLDKLWIIGGVKLTTSSPSPGMYAPSFTDEVWVSADGATWAQLDASTIWSKRWLHTSVVFNNALFVIGGQSLDGHERNVWSTTDGNAWTSISSNAPWGNRVGHEIVAFNGELWLIAGYVGEPKNDIWKSSDGATWALVTEHAPFPEKHYYSAVVFKNQIWVMGGKNQNNIWVSPNGMTWEEIPDIDYFGY